MSTGDDATDALELFQVLVKGAQNLEEVGESSGVV